MASREQIEIVSPTGQVRFYQLDPSVGAANIGQHSDNDLVLNGQNVRLFHALIDHRRRPYQFVSIEEDGGFGAEQPFGEWERIRIGAHELVLVNNEATGGWPASNTHLTADYAQSTNDDPLPIEAGPEAHWRVKPGQTVRHNLVIQNSGDNGATFIVSADGVPAEWLWLSQQTIALEPGGQATVQLAVAPPVGPDIQPGVSGRWLPTTGGRNGHWGCLTAGVIGSLCP